MMWSSRPSHAFTFRLLKPGSMALCASRKGAESASVSPKPEQAKTATPEPKPSKPVAPNVEPSSGKSKQQRLTELLEAYKKDALNAEEYHRARAKILAEP